MARTSIIPTTSPSIESRRLEIISNLGLLDQTPDPAFDVIVHTASRLVDCPIAVLTILDARRQWFASAVGLDIRQTDRHLSFCTHSIQQAGPTLVIDTLIDDRFKDNPFVVSTPGVRFYLGHPIAVEGVSLGTLCVMDHAPRNPTPSQVAAIGALANTISALLQARHPRSPTPDRAHDRMDPPTVAGEREKAATARIVNGTRRQLALYVDDFALNRLVMRNLFEAIDGWSLDLAEDGPTCLEHLAWSHPDLLLIDIHLDGVEGATLLHLLRQMPGLADVPAVAVSADGQPDDIAAAREAGFDDYWVKPIRRAQVEHTLATLFPKR